MGSSKIGWMIIAVVAFAGVLIWATHGHAVRAANSSEQVVFSDSGTGFGTFVNPNTGKAQGTPFGYWIWCEADSANPYQGECHGAMYFYAFAITKGVSGEISETGTPNQYVAHVVSRDNAVNCSVENIPPVTKGPTNSVIVSCSQPSGSGSDAKAVVNVTGP